MAQSSVETAALNRTLVEDAFKAWQVGTGGPFDLLADEVTWTIAGRSLVSKTYPDRESFLREVIRPFNARMREPLIPTVREVVADGDRVVIRFDAAAMAHDGKPYTNSYAWFLSIRAGRIVDAVAFFDSIAFDELWMRVSPAGTMAALRNPAART